jgi:dolichyl-phosphate-mannose-protein mannosyltransferase
VFLGDYFSLRHVRQDRLRGDSWLARGTGGTRRAIPQAELFVVLVAAIIPPIVKLTCYPDYPGSDDAFIHLTVVRNIAHGNGWGIEPGHRVNISTSPLFTLILSGIAALGASGAWVGQIISMAFAMAGILCLHRACVDTSDTPLLRACSVLLGAFQVHLWRWSGVVMETTLAALLVILVFRLYYRVQRHSDTRLRDGICLGAVIGLALLTRPELGLLLPSCVVPLIWFRTGSRLRTTSCVLAGFVIVTSAWLSFSRMYFGAILPTSFYAKTRSFHLGNLEVAHEVVKVLVSGAPCILFLIAVFGATYVWRGRPQISQRIWSEVFPVAFFPLALFAFYLTKTSHLQSPARYCLPALTAMPLLVCLLGEALWVRDSRAWLGRLAVVCATVQIVLSLYVNHTYVTPVLREFKSNYWRAMRDAARELVRVCKAGDTVLVEVDIGVVSYEDHGRCRIADGGALASPELRGMSFPERIDRSHANYVLESMGQSGRVLAMADRRLESVHSWTFRSHAVAYSDAMFVCNLYRVSTVSHTVGATGWSRGDELVAYGRGVGGGVKAALEPSHQLLDHSLSAGYEIPASRLGCRCAFSM